MFVKLEKLAFYHFPKNPELLYYYASTDTIVFKGIATPELALTLYDHLEAGKIFECRIARRKDQSLKLVELHQKASLVNEVEKPEFLGGKLIPFSPKQVSFYKHENRMRGSVKSYENETFFGFVTKTFVKWLLTNIRRQSEVLLTVKNKEFIINSENVPDDEYLERQESTYLDNKERFFFANESPTLRQSDYLKKEKAVFVSV